MAKHIKRHPDYTHCKMGFPFANTGKERPETLDFVRKCEVEWKLPVVWLEAKVSSEYGVATGYKVVSYETAARNGEPFEAMLQKYGVPNQSYPHCTRELKLQPIKAWARDFFQGEPYMTAIGIRVDEARRIRISETKCYPLVEWGVNVAKVREFWNNSPFDLQLRDYEGNCDLCWKKSTRKLLTLMREKPELAAWWNEMEIKYGNLRLDTRTNAGFEEAVMRFNRKSVAVTELVEQSKRDFTPVTDPYWKDAELDQEEPCACMLQEEEAA